MVKRIMHQDSTAARQQLYDLLGDLPSIDRPVSARLIKEETLGNARIEVLLLDLNGVEQVPAYFIKPVNHQHDLPVVLYTHAHGGNFELGKNEVLHGRKSLQQPAYYQPLIERGYAVFCMDMWGFGERRGRKHSELFKDMLWHGQVLWGMMVFDTLRATDYVLSRNDVDATRLASMGLSMGSTMAWWHAALDTRVKVCIDLCCLTDYQALRETRGLDHHDIYYYVPNLLKHFSTAQINALIAPRAHLSLAGRYDPLTPIQGLKRIDTELKRVYANAGAPDAWQLNIYDTGHYETPAMRQDTLEFLEAWL